MTPQNRILMTFSKKKYSTRVLERILEHMKPLPQNQKEQIAQRVEELINEKKTEKQILQALEIK